MNVTLMKWGRRKENLKATLQISGNVDLVVTVPLITTYARLDGGEGETLRIVEKGN